NCMAEVMVTDALADLHPPETSQDWATWLAEYARLVRRMELAHRDGARILAEADLTLGSFGSSADLTVRVLHNAGFALQSALVCLVTTLNYVLGNAFQIQGEPSHTPLDSGSRKGVPSIIDPKRFPTLAHFVDESSIPLAALEEWFEKGLRLLL